MTSIAIDNVDGSHSLHVAIARQNSIAITEENGSNKLVITDFVTASGHYSES